MKKIIAILGIMFSVNSFAADDVLISACVNKITKNMRHINAPQACKRTEYLLSWNQKGPQGIQGAVGPQGPAGTGSASTCTQESLAGTWLDGEYSAGPDMSGYLQAFGIYSSLKFDVDTNGNISQVSTQREKYDDNGNLIGSVNYTNSGTLKISSIQPNIGCSVELKITGTESYINAGDAFQLAAPSEVILSNMRLNNEIDEIKWNIVSTVPEVISEPDPDTGATNTTPAHLSIETFKLFRMQNGN